MRLHRICRLPVILAIVLIGTAASRADSEVDEGRVTIHGAVCTAEGTPVAGVEVCWVYMGPAECPYEGGGGVTDAEGLYEFEVVAGRRYYVGAGGKTATYLQSPWFPTKSGADVSVKDLIVRPYSASITGQVFLENGQPAANLDYGFVSENCAPLDPSEPPKTGSQGEFVIEHLLPDEPYSFWVFVEKNVYCVWRRLNPGVSPRRLTLRKSDYVTLPEDWLSFSTHEAVARYMVYARDAKIDFKLPDLNGRMVSLSEIRTPNKAVVVTITGTWCGGCRLETPYLVEYYNRYQDKGLEIVGIAFESPTNAKPLETLRSFQQEFNITYPLLYGGPASHERVASAVKGLELFGGYPTTIYIGRDGKVQFIQTGFWIHSEPHKKWQLEQMERHIRSILSSREAPCTASAPCRMDLDSPADDGRSSVAAR